MLEVVHELMWRLSEGFVKLKHQWTLSPCVQGLVQHEPHDLIEVETLQHHQGLIQSGLHLIHQGVQPVAFILGFQGCPSLAFILIFPLDPRSASSSSWAGSVSGTPSSTNSSTNYRELFGMRFLVPLPALARLEGDGASDVSLTSLCFLLGFLEVQFVHVVWWLRRSGLGSLVTSGFCDSFCC
ncbi:hypothetical protein Tco_0988433 [Tanacetum coccineum]|uniref:Uncharacterized protein n=1 Tax=Tanacetum coccineum TaxID=301880 RepID=A0ABQ5ERA3_9ASTR